MANSPENGKGKVELHRWQRRTGKARPAGCLCAAQSGCRMNFGKGVLINSTCFQRERTIVGRTGPASGGVREGGEMPRGKKKKKSKGLPVSSDVGF